MSYIIRYAKLSVPEGIPALFCTDKYENDKLIARSTGGRPILTKPPVPFLYEDEPFRDIYKDRITLLQKEFKEDSIIKQKNITKKMYSKAACEIPDVLYNPFTALKLMKSKERKKLFLNAANTGLPLAYTTSASDYTRQHDTERAFIIALTAARNGNQYALAEYYKNINDDVSVLGLGVETEVETDTIL